MGKVYGNYVVVKNDVILHALNNFRELKSDLVVYNENTLYILETF